MGLFESYAGYRAGNDAGSVMLQFSQLSVENQRVVIREDFNVPMQDGHITHDARLVAAIPTIQMALQKKARIILLSHLGRPEEGRYQVEFSLKPVAQRLAELLKHPVRFEPSLQFEVAPQEIVLCENTRFLEGEKKNDPILAKKWAALGDVFVMDAFAVAHRAEASTVGIAQYAKIACAGPLLMKELHALEAVLKNPKHPVVAIVGGSKVSTKIELLESLLDKVDVLILGGGIANTFLAAKGCMMGTSLLEKDWIEKAKELLVKSVEQQKTIWLPTDARVTTKFSPEASAQIFSLQPDRPVMSSTDMMLDIGPESEKSLQAIIATAGTVLWNGPLGVFEFPAFAHGTQVLAEAIAASSAYSLAGGGDTLSAISQFGVTERISYVSTGGGALLEFLEGKVLPGIQVLEERENN
jgi:phosphoglycerate kinase